MTPPTPEALMSNRPAAASAQSAVKPRAKRVAIDLDTGDGASPAPAQPAPKSKRDAKGPGAPVTAAGMAASAATTPPPPTRPVPMTELDVRTCIRVRGAREHNLKNIDVNIPRDRLVVITGLSGSGKSSLAFDTIFAEGQRKYMESLSAYARQFLDQLKKPDVDDIEGLPPTIAIEQRSGVANPRSTVATTTEIYDYLRLLYARCGSPTCWFPTKTKKDGGVAERCGRPITATTATQIIDAVMALGLDLSRKHPQGEFPRMMVLSPVVRARKGFHKDVLEEVQGKGWGRVRVAPGGKNPAVLEIRDVLKKGGENPLDLGRYEKHSIDVVVDRIVPRPETRQRVAEAVEAALRLADGTVIVAVEEPAGEGRGAQPGGAAWHDHVYSEKFACPIHPECALEELSPRLFSFNSPWGACAECHGLGMVMEFDEDLCVPDRTKSLAEGAVKPWKVPPPMGRFYRRRLRHFADSFGVSMHQAVGAMPEAKLRILLRGTTPEDEKKFGAKFEGVGPGLRQWYEKTESSFIREWLSQYMHEAPCPACHGDRLKIEALHVQLGSSHAADTGRAFSETVIGRAPPRAADGRSLNVAELSRLTINDAADFIRGLSLTAEQHTIAEPVLKELLGRLGFLTSVGLDYLSLDRKTGTLSGGEAQRIRLATQVGSKLVGACYVLDEPTIGLHQRDNARLISTLRHLADIGNTVLVVEHDEDMIRCADHVLDVGPGPGVHGGKVIAQGTVPEIIAEPGSLTGQYLGGVKRIRAPRAGERRAVDPKNAVCVKGARENNLKGVDAAFPLGGLVCVTGVSGSGKSTLVNDILLQAAKRDILGSRVRPGAHDRVTGLKKIDRVIEVDQSPIGRTPRSNPATYTGVFDEIRRIFATTKEAKIRGYKPGRFSFNVRAKNGGGRCEACEGQGLKKIEMHFLPDVYVSCEVCGGTRYNRETLEVKYRGKSIADVLKMTIEEASAFFENHPRIHRFVTCLRDVGLGYVELGQPSTQLSGGEAQRVKLATELGKIGGPPGGRRRDGDEDGDDAPASAVADDLDVPDDEDVDGADELDEAAVESSLRRGTPEREKTSAERAAERIAAASAVQKTLYVLDEPTTGLHFDDVNRLIEVLNRLADGGHTLVVIEHNLDVIKCADWIIDLGPEGGDRGGQIVAAGTPEQVMATPASHTGRFLKMHLDAEAARDRARR
jgi:excinuclease ABC subunit A